MEETGIIRRMDALGRIVIPREFRKLNRIEIGDPLEMRAMANGEIVIRKVDLSAHLKSLGMLAADTLGQYLDKPVGVCSTEEWLFGAKTEQTQELSASVAAAVQSEGGAVLTCGEAGIPCRAALAAVYPVVGETGVFGALVLFTDTQPTDTERALMETVAKLTGKRMQKF